jgi:hypothetical protein
MFAGPPSHNIRLCETLSRLFFAQIALVRLLLALVLLLLPPPPPPLQRCNTRGTGASVQLLLPRAAADCRAALQCPSTTRPPKPSTLMRREDCRRSLYLP